MTTLLDKHNARPPAAETYATPVVCSSPASSVGSCPAPAGGRSWPARRKRVSLADETQNSRHLLTCLQSTIRRLLVRQAHAVQHRIGSLDRIAHRVHCRALHVRQVKPRDIAASNQPLVEALDRGLSIPLVCIHHVAVRVHERCTR